MSYIFLQSAVAWGSPATVVATKLEVCRCIKFIQVKTTILFKSNFSTFLPKCYTQRLQKKVL